MRISSVIALVTGVFVSGPAAANFDAATGTVRLESAAWSLDFESGADATELDMYFGIGTPAIGEEGLASFVVAGEGVAISGDGALLLQSGNFDYGVFDLRSVGAAFRGRRIELTFWQRTRGTRITPLVEYIVGNVESAIRFAPTDDYHIVSYLPMQPSGLVTDDGWVQWTTGPMDATAAGLIDPSMLVFWDAKLSRFVPTDPNDSTLIDAMAIYDLGPAAVPDAACTGGSETSDCGELGVCMWRRCVDSGLTYGHLPEALRSDYFDRLRHQVAHFEGGREPLRHLSAFEADLADATAAKSPTEMQAALNRAFSNLVDGHASPPQFGYTFPVQGGVCLSLSEADLLPEGGEAPMVIARNTGPDATQMQDGDVVTAIDGLSVAEWMQRREHAFSFSADARARTYSLTRNLYNIALSAGSVMDLARCNRTDGIACDEGELERFTVDLGSLTGPMWTEGALPAWRNQPIECDGRFRRGDDSTTAGGYTYANWADLGDDGSIRYLIINGVPSEQWQGGAQWFASMRGALTNSAPDGFILDERTGGGGSIDAVDLIASYFVESADLSSIDFFPPTEREDTPELLNSLRTCAGGACILSFSIPLGITNGDRSGGAKKLAILNGLDVSGNDYLPRALTYRTGPTRIFGPSPTWGAFGGIVGLPPVLNALQPGSIQIQDSVFRTTFDDPTTDFATGFGVEEDERVLQKQSDAVLGVDTMLARAIEWLGTP